MMESLAQIALRLNKQEIRWGLGASLLLNLYGLESTPGDIDIFVDLADADKAKKVLSQLGEEQTVTKRAPYATKIFSKYAINGIGVDMMAGFQICHGHGRYQYLLNEEAIVAKEWIFGERIPLTALEDWFILYQLIPGRMEKAERIENYFTAKGIRYPERLQRALEEELPPLVRTKAARLLTSDL